jgi:hypothetical protein
MSQASFDTVSYIGNRQLFIQTCTQDDDTTLVYGEAIFNRAQLKHIGECKITRFYEDTIYLKATIEISTKKQYDSLYNYFLKLVADEYTSSWFNKTKICSGSFQSKEGKRLNASFIAPKRKNKAILIIG